MRRASPLVLLAVSASLITGCGTDAQLNVRPVGAVAVMPVGDVLAEARANFAMNNVALALEQFRRAARLAPDSVDAINGIAACYDRMGRYDISRLYYEKALAVDPSSQKTRHNFALSLTAQGRPAEALALAREPTVAPAPVAMAAVASPDVAPVPAPAPVVAPPQIVRPVTEEAPEKVPHLERVSLGEVALVTVKPQPKTVDRVVQVTQAKLIRQTATSSEWSFAEAPAKAPAKPAAPPRAPAPAPIIAAAAPSPAPARPPERPATAVITLVAPAPLPPAPVRPAIMAADRRPASVRSAAVAQPSPALTRVQVLNAVGRKGLAGRYSQYLRSRGMAQPRAADAVRMRPRTMILYPAGARAQAAALAKRLPFRPVLAPGKQGGSELILFLGTDSLAFDNRLRQRSARA